MSARLEIPWATLPPDGLSWARTGTTTSALHLVKADAWENTALCGTNARARGGYDSGRLCAACQKEAGLTSLNQLAIDQDEAEWMAAQREANR